MKLCNMGIMLLLMLAVLTTTADAQLIDNGDGTITDTHTGLMWLQTTNYADWNGANTYVNSLNDEAFASYDDWRLPSGEQAQDLGEFHPLYVGYGILAEGRPFNNMIHAFYWTSTEDPADASNALAFHWTDPALISFSKDEVHGVWPVRTIPGGAPDVEVDVWIKDYWNDGGSEPSSRSGESIDIFILNDSDAEIDLPAGWDNPQGQPNAFNNTVMAWVRNRSDVWIIVRASLYTWNCAEEETFTDADHDDDAVPVMLGPHERSLVVFDDVLLPNWAANGGDWCLGVVLSHPDDPPSSLPVDPREDNNIATASLMFIFEREGHNIHWKWVWWEHWGKWVALVFVCCIVMTVEWILAGMYHQKPPEFPGG